MTIEEFEREVIAGLLAGDSPVLETLRKQFAVAVVRDREIAAGGFVTRFEIPAGVPRIDRKLLHLDDLQLQLAGSATPADVSLHVYEGKLRSLECFVYDGAFPATPEIEAAWYYGTRRFEGVTSELMAERDIDELLEDVDE